eukprot:GFYU01008072.1.p1 GENE.GFYU01008072.1~~GFYU01008072.1.p1  ORF type:complete len:109 (-),score=43.70 GFYU01008072.1:147-473(-)
MVVLYEVNLTVDADVGDKYKAWLLKHMEEMLEFNGFLSAQLLVREEENADASKCYWTAQYRLENRESLQEYFDKHSAKMREEGMTLFKDKFTANRRILAVDIEFSGKK